jgi:malate dehydrogenase (oxaloacetate-decarboxylating)(NADP+)
MKIPVFHDDQHGTAIIVGAAVLNGLKVVGKDIAKVKLVCSGAGAAATRLPRPACESRPFNGNIWVSDIKGVVYSGRKEEMDDNKARYAQGHEGPFTGRFCRAPTYSSGSPPRECSSRKCSNRWARSR